MSAQYLLRCGELKIKIRAYKRIDGVHFERNIHTFQTGAAQAQHSIFIHSSFRLGSQSVPFLPCKTLEYTNFVFFFSCVCALNEWWTVNRFSSVLNLLFLFRFVTTIRRPTLQTTKWRMHPCIASDYVLHLVSPSSSTGHYILDAARPKYRSFQ